MLYGLAYCPLCALVCLVQVHGHASTNAPLLLLVPDRSQPIKADVLQHRLSKHMP